MKPIDPINLPELKRMAQAMAIVRVPELDNAIQAMAHNERALAQLRALSCADDATIQRNVGMPQPTATYDELLSMLLNELLSTLPTGRLSDFVEALHEYGRRVEYCKRRYALTGRFEIESEEQ